MSRMNDFEMILVRHGDAASTSPTGDAGRPLTDSGRQKIQAVAPAFIRNEWFWSQAWVSPYLRARQTFDALAERMAEPFERIYDNPLPEGKESELLVPHGDAEAAARHLTTQGYKLFGPRPRQLVVAHNPLLQGLVSLLVCGDTSAQFAIGRGDMVHLFVPAPSPFDLILAPTALDPLPRAIVLGVYPRAALALQAAAP